MALPFLAQEFDAAVMALVIFFVPDPAKGVAEMVRVVSPGGTVTAYAWDMAGGGFQLQPVQTALLAMGFPPRSPAPLRRLKIDALEHLSTDAGLDRVETRKIEVRRTFANFDDFWATPRWESASPNPPSLSAEIWVLSLVALLLYYRDKNPIVGQSDFGYVGFILLVKWEEKSMRGYVTSLLAASIVVLVGGSTVGWAAGISDGVVKIGILTDMGGPLSDAAGKGSVVAAQLAADDFGGKVLGAPVQIVSADHQGKPDIASSLARAWFEQDHVDAVNDLVLSGVALAVTNVAKQLNRIALVNGAATDRLTNEECAPTTVHFAYDTYSIAQAISDTTIKQGGKKWFFIAVDTAGGKALEQVTSQFVKKNGGEVLGSVRYPSGTTDFSSYVLAAQASNADVIGLAMSGSELSDVIKTVKEFGLKQRLAATVALITDVHAVGLKIAQGMYIATAFYWDTDEATRAFSKRFFAKMGKMPTDVQAGVYSSTLLYLNSIKAAGTDDTNAVLAEMRKQKINDIFKNGYLREDGNVVHDMYLTQVKSPEESKYPWDYARVVTTIPGEQAYQPLSENRCPSLKK